MSSLPLIRLIATLIVVVSFKASVVVSIDSTPSPSSSSNNTLDDDSDNSVKCEENWHQHVKQCFYVKELQANETLTFDEARTLCKTQYDAQLATIEDADAQKTLTDILTPLKVSKDSKGWLGAQWVSHVVDSHAHAGGGFHWIFNDNPLNYTALPNGLPSAHDCRDCVGHCIAASTSNGAWYQVSCDQKLPLLICERDIRQFKQQDKAVLWALMYGLLGLILAVLVIGSCLDCLVRRKRNRAAGGGKFRGIYYKRSSTKRSDNGNL